VEGQTSQLDAVDHAIVDALRADGRLSMAKLAEQVSISRANAYRRVADLEDRGVIQGYSARIDPAALGLDLAALIMVTADQRQWRTLQHDLAEVPGVVYQAAATGPFDHVLLVRVAAVETLRDVVLEKLHSIPGVRSTQTVFLLDEHPQALP
jgi:Lrp/AsnC family transcriptional regulator, leucine-responsive regulatory protein